VTTKDTTTGEEKKEVVKVPVTRNKVVPKTLKPIVADIPLAVSPSSVVPTASPLIPTASPLIPTATPVLPTATPVAAPVA